MSITAKELVAPVCPTSTSHRPFGDKPVGAGPASSANVKAPGNASRVMGRPVLASIHWSAGGVAPSRA